MQDRSSFRSERWLIRSRPCRRRLSTKLETAKPAPSFSRIGTGETDENRCVLYFRSLARGQVSPTVSDRFLDLTQRAEELGFDSAWVSEHHFTRYGGILPRPQVLLAAMAERTKRIRLGTAVSLVPFDNPIRAAEDFALLMC